MPSLGSASGSLTIDASQAIQAVKGLVAELGGLKGVDVGDGGFGVITAAANAAAAAVKEASGVKFEVDSKDAISALASIGVAAEDTAGRVKIAGSGGSFSVRTDVAMGMLVDLALEAEETAGRIKAAATGSSFAIDTSAAVGDLAGLSGAVRDAVAAVSGSAAKFTVDTGTSVDDLLEVGLAAELAASAIKAASSQKFTVDTGAALGDLATLSGAIKDLAASMSGQNMTVTVDTAAAVGALNDLSTSAQATADAIGKPLAATVTVAGTGELDAVASKAKEAQKAVEDIGSASPDISFGRALSDLQAMSTSLGGIQNQLSGLGRIGLGAGLAGLIIAPLAIGIKYAADLEQSLKNVDVVLGGLNKTDLSRLQKSVIDIGTSTQFSAKEVADVALELGKAGASVTSMIEGKMLPAVVDLAAATGDSLTVAVRGIVQAMSLWSPAIVDSSIAMTDASRAADILTVAANSSIASVEDIIRGMRSLGPVAAQLGVSFGEAAAAISIFTNYGLRGADAGVSLARGLQNLQKPTSEGARLMDELGIKIFDLQGNFIGLPQLFGQLSNSLSGATQEVKFNAISTLFGAEAMDAYAIAIATGVDPLVAIINQMREQGVASDQAAARVQTLSGAMERLQETSLTMLGVMGSAFIGPITGVANGLTFLGGVVAALPSPITTTIGVLGGFVGTALAVAVAAGTVSMAIKGMGSIIGNVPGIAKLISGLSSLKTAFLALRASSAILATAFGPIGLAIAAAAVIGGLFWLNQRKNAQEAKKAQDDYNTSVKDTDKVINDTANNGETKLASNMKKVTDDMRGHLNDVTKLIENGRTEWENAVDTKDANQLGKNIGAYFDTAVGQAALEWAHTNKKVSDATYDMIKNGTDEGLQRAIQTGQVQIGSFMGDYFQSFAPTNSDKTMLEGKLKEVFKIFENPHIDPKVINQSIGDIFNKYLSGATPDLIGAGKALDDLTAAWQTVGGEAGVTQKEIAAATDGINLKISSLKLNGDTAGAKNFEGMTKNFSQLNEELSKTNFPTYQNDLQGIFDVMQSGKVDNDLVNAGFTDLNRQLSNGQITAVQYGAAVHYMMLNMDQYATSAAKATAEQEKQNKIFEAGKVQAKSAADANAELARARTGEYPVLQSVNSLLKERAALEQQVGAAAASGADPGKTDALVGRLKEINDLYAEQKARLADLGVALDNNGGMHPLDPYAGMGEKADKLKENAKALADLYNAANDKRNESSKALADHYKEIRDAQDEAYSAMISKTLEYQGIEENLGKINMSGLGNAQTKQAEAIQKTSYTMDAYNRIIVGNTNAIAQNAQGVNDWAIGLINVAGEQGKIDELLTNGIITQTEYNRAQEAGTRIFAANASIQEQILGIQAQQAPQMAGIIEKQAEHIKQLGNMSDAEQLVALGWMDASTAAEANAIVTQAAAAANGDLGASGMALTQQMIQGAVDANPILGLMLEQLGYISLGADGTVTINEDAIKSANSEMSNLTKSIDRLTLALGGIPPFSVDTAGLMTAEQRVKAVTAALKDLGGERIRQGLAAAKEAGNAGAGADANALPSKGDLTKINGGGEVTVNTANALKGIANVLAGIKDVDNARANPKITVDEGDSKNGIGILAGALKDIGEANPKPKVTPEGMGTAFSLAESLNDTMIDIGNVKVDPKVTVDAGEAQTTASGITTTLTTLGGYDAHPNITMKDGVSGPAAAAKSAVDAIKDKTVTVTVNQIMHGMSKEDRSPRGANAKPQETVVTTKLEVVDNASAKIAEVNRLLAAIKSPPAIMLTVTATGLNAIRTVSTDIGALKDKTVVVKINGDNSLYIAAINNATARTIPDKIGKINGDTTLYMAAYFNVNGLVIADKVGKINGDMLLYNAAYNNVNALVIADKIGKINGDTTLYMAAYFNVNGLLIADKIGKINGDTTLYMAAYFNVNGLLIDEKVGIISGDNSLLLAAVENAQIAMDGMTDKTLIIAGDNSLLIAAVNNAQKAIDGLTGKTVTITINTVGSVPKLATGGYTPSATVRLAERGPEMFTTPSGTRGIAQNDGLYNMPVGTYINTAAETRRILRGLSGDVKGYANGGTIQGYANGGLVKDAYGYNYSNKIQDPKWTGQFVDQLAEIARQIDAYGGESLKQTGKTVRDMMNDTTKITETSVEAILKNLKDYGWPAPVTTALLAAVRTTPAGGMIETGQPLDAYAQSVYGQLSTIAKEIEDYGGIQLRETGKTVRDMMKDVSSVTSEELRGVLGDLKGADWAGTKTQALINQVNKQEMVGTNPNSAYAKLNTIASEIESQGGKDFESIAKSVRDLMNGGPITSDAVQKVVKDLQDKGWAGTKTQALANALKATSTSINDASNLFSDESWSTRAKSKANPNDVTDLFAGRTRTGSGRDFTLNNGKYTEHYGGQAPPTGVGSKAPEVNHYYALDAPSLVKIMKDSRSGATVEAAITRIRAIQTANGQRVPVR